MQTLVMLVKLGAGLFLTGLLFIPASTGAEQYPAFLSDVRKTIVYAGSFGVLASPTRILTIQHGSVGRLSPGAETTLAFTGLWEALHPEQARAQSIAPQEFRRTARLLCSFEDVDVAWLELLEPAPKGATPVTLSRRYTPTMFVLPVLRGAPPVVRGTFTGEYLPGFGFAVLQLQGVTVLTGWSGSPVVNDRGEVVGLVVRGDAGLASVAGPIKTCAP